MSILHHHRYRYTIMVLSALLILISLSFVVIGCEENRFSPEIPSEEKRVAPEVGQGEEEHDSSENSRKEKDGNAENSSNDKNSGAGEEDQNEEESDPSESSLDEEQPGLLDGFIKATVTYVVDGDTYDVKISQTDDNLINLANKDIDTDIAGTTVRVRPILIDAPEICHQHSPSDCEPEPYGDEATDFAVDVLMGGTVYLQKDNNTLDPFDRYLFYTYLEDGRMFQEMLLDVGLAEVAVYDDIKYKDRFFEIEAEAQENNLGMWSE